MNSSWTHGTVSESTRIEESLALTKYHKEKGHAHATNVVIADASHILHDSGNSILNSLFIRVRHAYLSVCVCSQRPHLVYDTHTYESIVHV